MNRYTAKHRSHYRVIRNVISDEKSLFRHIFWYRFRRRLWKIFKTATLIGIVGSIFLMLWLVLIHA